MWVTQQADHSPTAFKNNNYGIVSKKIALSPCKVRNRPPCDKRCRCLEQQSRDSRDKGAGRNQRRVGRGHIYILAEVKLSSSRRWQQQQRMILVVKYEITLKKKNSTDETEEKGLTVCLSRSRFTPVPSYLWFNLWFVFFWKAGFKETGALG